MRFISFLLIICFSTFTGCSSCSRAGKEAKRKQLMTNAHSLTGTRPILKESSRRNSSPEIPSSSSTLGKLYEENKKGVFLVFSSNDLSSGAQGSGFFISAEGVGVSNQHVFDGYKNHQIKLYDGTTYQVSEILRSSSSSDLDYVIFKVNTRGSNVHALPVAKSLSAVGDNVFAIGNPRGLEQTLSTGIVSSYRENNKYIQTTAEITNGSSGGPLFNMNDKVIGITTSGVGEANLNFAVNINKIRLP